MNGLVWPICESHSWLLWMSTSAIGTLQLHSKVALKDGGEDTTLDIVLGSPLNKVGFMMTWR